MTKIKAAQHIYGNVEKERSPGGYGGFQTLFYSKKSLSQAGCEGIEERVLYYQSEANPRKSLFFQLSGGKVVVSRIVPLAGTDKFGREGSYLAHSVVITGEEFSRIGSHPFVLFELVGDRFLSRTEDAFAAGNAEDGTISEMVLEPRKGGLETIEKQALAEAGSWPVEELKKIAYYAVGYEQVKRQREPLVFAGPQDKIETALKTAFLFVPAHLRFNCNFDTYFEGCNLVHSDFWGVAYPEVTDAPRHLPVVDVVARTVRAQVPGAVSPYLYWVFDRVAHRDLQGLMSAHPMALEFREFLEDRAFDEAAVRRILDELGAGFFQQMTGVYRDVIAAKVAKILERTVGKMLAGRLSETVTSGLEARPRQFFFVLLDGFEPGDMAEKLYHIYRKDILRQPEKKERKELAAFLKKTPHPGLSLSAALWEKNFDDFVKTAAGFSEADYKDVVFILEKLGLKPLREVAKEVKKYGQVFPEGLGKILAEMLENLERRQPEGRFKKLWRKIRGKR